MKICWMSSDGSTWELPRKFMHDELDELVQLLGKPALRQADIYTASVVEALSISLEQKIETRSLRFLRNRQIPAHKLDYDTPETLGIDRYLSCLGAVQFAGSQVVVIDAGTACTIDFMDDEDVYHGGMIMPGLAIWERGLRQHAPALPETERSIPDRWPGQSTEASIRWGLYGGFRDIMTTALDRFERTYGTYQLFVTGGDAGTLAGWIDRPAERNQMLVFEGMRQMVAHQMDGPGTDK